MSKSFKDQNKFEHGHNKNRRNGERSKGGGKHFRHLIESDYEDESEQVTVSSRDASNSNSFRQVFSDAAE